MQWTVRKETRRENTVGRNGILKVSKKLHKNYEIKSKEIRGKLHIYLSGKNKLNYTQK
jgi:hypothetical protein